MPQRIIDLFELVKIDVVDRKPLVPEIFYAALETLIRDSNKISTIENARQIIVSCFVGKSLVDPFEIQLSAMQIGGALPDVVL